MKSLASVVHDHITRQLQPLEARIAALEARPAVVYRGVWRGDYRSNQECQGVFIGLLHGYPPDSISS
jgi:hypothetical protein